MCANCVTTADALSMNAVGAAAVAGELWRRAKSVRLGETRLERRARAYGQDAELMRSMGLDPVAVLGPPPGLATPAAEPVAARG